MAYPDIIAKLANLGDREWLDDILMRNKIMAMANNKWSEYEIG